MFKLSDNACPWLSRKYSKWLLCLSIFQAWWQCQPLALYKVSSLSSSLSFVPANNAFCGFSVGGWLLYVTVFQACWQCLPKPTDDAYPWLSSLWVAAVPCCASGLLIMSLLSSLDWVVAVPCTVFQTYWWCLSLTLQFVSGCSVLLCPKLTDDPCSWVFRKWVAAVPCLVSNLVMIPILGSSICEWLQCPAVSQAYWWCLSFALQEVSGCSALLCFKPTDDTYSWLSRK